MSWWRRRRWRRGEEVVGGVEEVVGEVEEVLGEVEEA